MENVENTVVKPSVTRTDLSDWSGAPVKEPPVKLDIVKIEERVVGDSLDIGLRGFDLLEEAYGLPDGLSYGPASAPLAVYHPINLFRFSETMVPLVRFYEGVSWDSIQFRITLSNPKGIAGGIATGVFPYPKWNTGSFNDQRTAWDLNHMTRQHLILSPQSELMTCGEAKDVVFNVPWQYNVPYIPYKYLYGGGSYSDASSATPLWPGTPVLYFISLGMYYVSSQAYPANIKVFITFDNLKWYGPRAVAQSGEFVPNQEPEHPLIFDFEEWESTWHLDNSFLLEPLILKMEQDLYEQRVDLKLEPQSGLESAVMASVVTSMGAVGAEIMDAFVPDTVRPDPSVSSNHGTYENPQAVQLAYVGDSTKVGPPSTTPFFKDYGDDGTMHPVSDYIGQPQYIGNYTSGSEDLVLYANPTAPRGTVDLNGNDQSCTYLRYFSQCASYWRGTIIFDIVIMGTPLVEVEYLFRISYPFAWDLLNMYSRCPILRGICSGVFRISIPMPFMVLVDHMPVHDIKGSIVGDIRNASSSILKANIKVISTALDVAPVIPYVVTIRAGEDFTFLQPYAVGLGYVENSGQLENLVQPKSLKKSVRFQAQIGLPPPNEVFESRAKAQLDTSQMKAMIYIEDWMAIWSRALPYTAYDSNDEPIVTVKAGISPFWYPMEKTGAATTLGTQNSWWVTNDYVSFYSSMFLYYKGSIGYKILCKPSDTGYKYVSQTSGNGGRQLGHNPFTSNSAQLPPQANFGYGTVATDGGSQPVLEFTIPLRSSLEWAFANPESTRNLLSGFFYGTYLSGSCQTNVVLHTAGSDLEAAMYRKAGKDFALAVQTLLPPPTLWVAKGYNWS